MDSSDLLSEVFLYASLILDSFDLLELFRFPFSDTNSPTPMDCCYWFNGAHSKARSSVLLDPTFELSFGCLIVCDSFLIQCSLYPLVFLLSTYFPLRARLRKYIFADASSRLPSLEGQDVFVQSISPGEIKKAACSHAGRSFACSHAGRSFD